MKWINYIIFLGLPLHSTGQDVEIIGPSLTKIFTDDLYYSPAITNNAQFREKNEISITGFMICSYGFNAAWSAGKHIAIYANYGMTPRDKHRLHTYGAGVGYYGIFGAKKFFTYSVNGHFAVCNAKINLKDTGLKEKLNSYSYYLNGELGFRHYNIETALSAGVSFFNFYGYQDLNGAATHKWLYGEFLDGRSEALFLPGFTIRGGPQYLKFGTQLFVPVLFNNTDEDVNFYDHCIALFTISGRFSIGKNDGNKKQAGESR